MVRRCKEGINMFKTHNRHVASLFLCRCRGSTGRHLLSHAKTDGVILEFTSDATNDPEYKIIKEGSRDLLEEAHIIEAPAQSTINIIPPQPEAGKSQVADSATEGGSSTGSTVTSEKDNSTDMQNGIILVKNKTSKGQMAWSPLNPQLVPSMLAANFCKPLEVMLCEPPGKKGDPMSVSTLHMKTKGLLELSKDKTGFSIQPVKKFPSEEKGPKVSRPRYRRLDNSDSRDSTVIKTVRGVNVMDMQREGMSESEVETPDSVRRSGRQRRPPRRPGDETATNDSKRIIFQVRLQDPTAGKQLVECGGSLPGTTLKGGSSLPTNLIEKPMNDSDDQVAKSDISTDQEASVSSNTAKLEGQPTSKQPDSTAIQVHKTSFVGDRIRTRTRSIAKVSKEQLT